MDSENETHGVAPDGFRDVEVHGEQHLESTDVRRTQDVPEGAWVDVRSGQRVAEGTVTRDEWPGLLFDAQDPTKVICWHLKPSVFVCNRRNIQPEQVVIEEGSNSPWCPTCLAKKKQLAKQSQIKGRRKIKREIASEKARKGKPPEIKMPKIDKRTGKTLAGDTPGEGFRLGDGFYDMTNDAVERGKEK